MKVRRFLAFSPRSQERRSFALISVLLVLTILTIMTVGFLASMRTERLTARSYLNVAKAQLIADSGLQVARVKLEQIDLTCPVTAYVRSTNTYFGSSVGAPYLVAYQLNSSFSPIATNYLSSAPKMPFTSTELIDINQPGDSAYGPVGLRDSSGSVQKIPVPWVYVTNQQNEVVGRYAYWIDDETSKIDLHVAGTNTPTHVHTDGASASEVSLHTLLGGATATNIVTKRLDALSSNLFFTPSTILGQMTTNNVSSTVTYTTLYGRGDERGATGQRKLDINAFVNTATNYMTTAGRAAIVQNVAQMAQYITNSVPTFGSRYYPGSVLPTDQYRYAMKVAANIHDYIDLDSQPTVIAQNLTSWQDVDLTNNYSAPAAPPAVFGKEVVPNADQYVAYFYANVGNLNLANSIDVWNIHSKDIDFSRIGPVSIVLKNRGKLTDRTSTTTIKDFKGMDSPSYGNETQIISVPNTTIIRAGTHGVLTTLPAASTLKSWQNSGGTNWTYLTNPDAGIAYGGGLKIFGDTSATADDCNTEVTFVNAYGYIDIQARFAQQTSAAGNNLAAANSLCIGTSVFGNDASSSANSFRCYPLDSGDPRSSTEFWNTYDPNPGTYSPSASRREGGVNYPSVNSPSAVMLGADANGPTYGVASDNVNSGIATSNYVPEPALIKNISSATNAFSVIRDGPMRTIGELGHIFDPAIYSTTSAGYYDSSTKQVLFRGGFRTFSIGSSSGELTGPNYLSQVTEANRAARLLEFFTTSTNTEGQINLNSALRDPSNAALYALLDQLKSQTNTAANAVFPSAYDGSLGNGVSINSTNFVTDLTAYAATNVFTTLGKLEDLPILNSGSTLFTGINLTPNAQNNNHLDRGREEFFRHIINRLCLKGTTFKIYVVGQSGKTRRGFFQADSTLRLSALVETQRTYPTTDPLANLNLPILSTNNIPTASTSRILQIHYE